MGTATAGILGVVELAEHFGVSQHIVRATLTATGLGRRLGRVRAVHGDDLPLVELALKARGHLRPEPAEGAAPC